MKSLDIINHSVLLKLTETDGAVCISFYMPIKRAGAEARQNIVLFRQLCQSADQKMERYGVGNKTREFFQEKLRALETNKRLWRDRTDGLAVFVGQDEITVYRAPVKFSAQVVVDKRFYIRPVLPLLHRGAVLTVVMLNQEGARLLHCNADHCAEVLPPKHLQTLQNYLGMYEFDKSLQFRSNASPAAHKDGSGYAPAYHGQGTAGDDAQASKYLEDYYQHFKNWLLKDGKLPGRVYLVADAHNEGLFKKAADGLAVEWISLIKKNIKDVDGKELTAAVQAVLEETAVLDGDAEYQQMQQKDAEVMHSPTQIVKAAHEKRIDTLFLPESDSQLWGWFDHSSNRTVVEKESDVMVGEELYNLAAIRTLQTGGTVIVRSGDMETAALCRW